MDLDKEERYQRELAEAAGYINDYLQEIPLYRPAHDWLIRNGFEDTSYQNDIFKDLDSGKKNMRQVKEELANMYEQNTEEKEYKEIEPEQDFFKDLDPEKTFLVMESCDKDANGNVIETHRGKFKLSDVFKAAQQGDPQDPNEAAKEAEKHIAIAVLEEFNEWRRGQGEYAWNEDPSKNKVLELTPKQIGLAIDYAVAFLKTH